ncbi:MAG: hypothetical protein AB7O66_07310 [Limisphaerales bacterium]
MSTRTLPIAVAPILDRFARAAASFGLVLVAVSSQAASFLVDIKTVTVRNNNASDSPLAERLFLDSGNPAPLGTPLWFIADLNRDGLGFESLGKTSLLPGELFGPDDFVVLLDVVDGDQPGSARTGVYRGIGYSAQVPDGYTAEQVQAGNIYAMLWDDPAASDAPLVGANFGIHNLGVNAKPSLGNPFWALGQDVFADTFSMIPEPETETALVAAGLLTGWMGWRFRFRRQRATKA